MPRLIPASVRARLLLAFTILAIAALLLAAVGWRSLTNTDRAMQGFNERVLPEIARSLELAERAANLAALAPYVAEVNVPFQLQAESAALRERIGNVLALARRIPDLEDAAPGLPALVGRLDDTLTALIDKTRDGLYLQEDIRQHLYRIGQLRDDADNGPAALPPALTALTAAAAADSTDALNRFRSAYDERVDALAGTPAATALRGIGNGEDGIFALRARKLAIEEEQAFLLAQTRALSEQLSSEVRTYVTALQQRVGTQAEALGATVRSGKTGIVVIALVCAAAAALGALLVRELVGNLKAVTHLMTRLAQGDTARATPATDRDDELGALARAFHVFRGNAVALDEQSRLLETVFHNINDGLSVFDAQGRLVTWNPQYLQILGLPAERIHTGMPLQEVQALLPPVASENRTPEGTALATGELNQRRQHQPQAFERHFTDGRVVEFRSRPMPDGGFVTLYSDLTARKTVEAQLRQSQKMEVLGQLTGGVAHDFNNLLAAVTGNLQLLDDDPALADRHRRYARRALAAAERGASLTARLLAFARKQRLAPQPTDVDSLVNGMVDLIEYSVGPAVRIELDLGARDAVVDVDREQLENALLNLAINASAAMPDGGRLTVRTRGTRKGPAVIEMADTGCGIPDAQLEHVLEPFYTTRESGGGSGLGLSIVYGFVKQSGGDVRITSRVGEGTSVRLELPTTIRPAMAADAAKAAPGGTTPARRVLLVEDDDDVRETACDMLERLGHEVVAVADAETAREALDLDAQGYDVMLTDVNLGEGGNGVELRREIVARDSAPAVVLTSGLSRDLLVKRYGLAEDVPVLAKPYRLDALAEAIGRTRDDPV
ncbi:PAS-domain containing protein [Arhodomonas sp. AD133]|uniref:PAS-domain containing protein n=1 Tax=Arhodomonas sp. AD133 TaxID=3415009 RepID=UPI003EB98995